MIFNGQNRFSKWNTEIDELNICVYGEFDITQRYQEVCRDFTSELRDKLISFFKETGGFEGVVHLNCWFVEAAKLLSIEHELPFVFRSVVFNEGTLNVFVELETQPQLCQN